jgi:RNA 3'-phosphate cyclase
MEGGGQILRMATTYSAILGIPVKIFNIRAKRKNPGLKPQHLTTLIAVAKICNSITKGLKLNSTEVEFASGSPKGGRYHFDIGTAGSISLLLQCLAPIAAFADEPSHFRITGGTNVMWSPPLPLLENLVWEALRKMGFQGQIQVLKEGFYPKGGGIVEVIIKPIKYLSHFIADSPETIQKVKGISLCGKLPDHVARRQAKSAGEFLKDHGYDTEISVKVARGSEAPFSPGSVIALWADNIPHLFLGSSSLGKRGKPAEKVGEEAAKILNEEMNTKAAVDKYTADNLVLWGSLAEGQSRYFMSKVTLHTRTAVELARKFTNADINIREKNDGPALLECKGIGLSNPKQ